MLALLSLLQDAGPSTGPFNINTGLIFWTVLIFVLLLGLLRWLAWPALVKSVEERERRIQQQLDDAQRANAEAAKLLEQQKQVLAKAKGEAQEMIAQAKGVAQKEREHLLAKAREEQDGMLERARREIDAERVKAVAALRREAVDLSIAAASKLVAEKLDTAANRRLVLDYLHDLERESQ